MRNLLLGRPKLPQRRWRDKTDQEPEDREDDKQLEQRETSLPASQVITASSGAE